MIQLIYYTLARGKDRGKRKERNKRQNRGNTREQTKCTAIKKASEPIGVLYRDKVEV